jgi:hypothetical protein
MLALLSLYDHVVAKSLVIKRVPWLREHQDADGLWHQEELVPHELVRPLHPRPATCHTVAALHRFGLLDSLRAQRRHRVVGSDGAIPTQ